MVNLRAAEGEPAGPVGHDALALRGADGGAEVGLPREARLAAAALRRVERDDVVALRDRGDARADVDDHARPFVAEDHREQPLGIGARAGELVGVADAGRLDLDQHLPAFGPSSSTSSITSGLPAWYATAARVFIRNLRVRKASTRGSGPPPHRSIRLGI